MRASYFGRQFQFPLWPTLLRATSAIPAHILRHSAIFDQRIMPPRRVHVEDSQQDPADAGPPVRRLAPGPEARAVKPDVPRFLGFTDPDVHNWLTNYEVVCRACNQDPALIFPNHCSPKVLSRLHQKRAQFIAHGWPALRQMLADTYARPINKIQLQAALNNRRQGVEESVSQYADALDSIAIQLSVKLDDVTGIFVAGLQDIIVDGGMKSRTFDTFADALAMARLIEENIETRRPRAAIPLASTRQPTQGSINSMVDDQQVPPALLAAIADAVQSHAQVGPWRRQFRGNNRRAPYDHRAPYDRPRQDPRRFNPNTERRQVNCSFCGYQNHEVTECRLKKELDFRLSRSGHAMTISGPVSLGPLLTTNEILIGGAQLTALVDSGATASFIHKSAIQHLQDITRVQQPKYVFTAGNGLPVSYNEAISTQLQFHPDSDAVSQVFFVSDTLPFDAVLGTDALVRAGVVIDVGRKVLIIEDGARVLALKPPHSNVLLAISEEVGVGQTTEDIDADENTLVDELTFDVDTSIDTETTYTLNSELSPAQAREANTILSLYSKVFLAASGAEPCLFPAFEIDTQDSPPVSSRPFRIPYSEREAVAAHVQKYLDRGWIVPSNSSWASPTLIVRRNGKERFCVDYRRLNAVTVPDRYPAPDIRDCFDRLAGCKYFSLCDADAAYHQCTVKDAHKLAFVTHDGLYQPTVLLFGPRNAPAYFQRNMSNAIRGIENVFAYLDDIMIATRTWEEHVIALQQLFEKLASLNVRLKPSKCKFGMSSVKYLGHIITAAGLMPDPEKIKAVHNLTTPSNVTDLRNILGLCGYYQQFVPRYAEIAAPLYELTRKEVEWCWSQVHEDAFLQLKQHMTSEPVLCLPDLNRPMELLTDASTHALGAVLQQRDEWNNPHPVAFASRVLSSAETRYCTQELECLAMIFGLSKFRTYLLGRHFRVYTDHKALLSVLSKPSASPRITRWSLAMQEYDFDIIHIPGTLNVVPDALSRQAVACMLLSTLDSEWKELQAADTFCITTIRQILATSGDIEESTGIAGFRLNDSGLLVLEDKQYGPRLVVPRSSIASVLEDAHAVPMSGHQGINRTVARVAASFFWPGWRRDVANFVRGCKSCQQRKDPVTVHPVPAIPVISNGPNDLIAMDLQGPLNLTAEGNQYILVIQDLFTKYVAVVGIKDASGIAVADAFLKHWIGTFGIPHRLLTDNGRNLGSAVLEDVTVLLKIKRVWTSPYRPQTDGSVERFNRTLNAMLSHYVNHLQDNWDEYLPLLALAYNSTYNYSAQQTPYYLMMGRQAPTVTEFLVHVPGGQDTVGGGEMRHAMKVALQASYDNIIRRQQQKFELAQQQLQSTQPYALGDEVLILDLTTPVGLKPKHRRRWIGPFTVSAVTGPLSYIVRKVNSLQEYRVHAEHMKRTYRFPSITSWPEQDQQQQPEQGGQGMRVSKSTTAPGVSFEASSPGTTTAVKPRQQGPPHAASPSREGENVV